MDRPLPSLAALAVVLAAALSACGPALRPAPLVEGGRPPTAGAAVPERAPARPGALVVRKGETLYRIARRHGVALRDLIDVNRLTAPYRIVPGQRLALPASRLHVVRKGDTIYGISRRYGVDMTTLVRLNDVPAPYRIAVGERLRLPGKTAASASRRMAASAPPSSGWVGAKNGVPRRAAPRRAARVAALANPPPRAARRFLWPVQGRLISRFGSRGKGLHNDGINIAARRGAAVRAAENGIVAYAGNELRGFGNLLLIKHADGWISAYAHNDAVLVREGQRVRRGQTISRVGRTGSVVRPQLHFELRRGMRAVDPVRYLVAAPVIGLLSPAASPAGRQGPG